MRYSLGESGVTEMNLQQIHDMAADALAGEELQFKSDGSGWVTIKNTAVRLLHPNFEWRIKPTIEVNGVMMSKRQAKAAWEASGATSYDFYDGTEWLLRAGQTPIWGNTIYRWQEPKWIYVNGEKIVRSGGHVFYHGLPVANDTEGEKLQAAIRKLIEIK